MNHLFEAKKNNKKRYGLGSSRLCIRDCLPQWFSMLDILLIQSRNLIFFLNELLLLCLGVFDGQNFSHPLLPSVLIVGARATAHINNLLIRSNRCRSCKQKRNGKVRRGCIRICCNHTKCKKNDVEIKKEWYMRKEAYLGCHRRLIQETQGCWKRWGCSSCL